MVWFGAVDSGDIDDRQIRQGFPVGLVVGIDFLLRNMLVAYVSDDPLCAGLSRRPHSGLAGISALAASRSAGVTAPSAYAPESSSNSSQVMSDSPFCLLDLYYDLCGFIDYHKRGVWLFTERGSSRSDQRG